MIFRKGIDVERQKMELIAEYTRAFPKHIGSGQFSSDHEDIFMSGTTGAIGTSMLAQLVDIPSGKRFYAFNRQLRLWDVTRATS